MDFEKLKLKGDIYKFTPNLYTQRINISRPIDEMSLRGFKDLESKIRLDISRATLEVIDSTLPKYQNYEYLDLRNGGGLSEIDRLVYKLGKKFAFSDSITLSTLWGTFVKDFPPLKFGGHGKLECESCENIFNLSNTHFFYYHPFNNRETLIFHDGIEYNITNPRILQSGEIFREMYVLGDRFECQVSAQLINPIKIGLVSFDDSETLKDPDYINWMRIQKLKNLI